MSPRRLFCTACLPELPLSARMDGVPCRGVARDGRVWRIPVEGKFETLSACWTEE